MDGTTKRRIGAALLLAGALMVGGSLLGTPVSADQGGGNAECGQGYFLITKFDTSNPSGTQDGVTVTEVAPPRTFNWTSVTAVAKILVKGGNDFYSQEVDGPHAGSFTYVETQGAGLSHLTFCGENESTTTTSSTSTSTSSTSTSSTSTSTSTTAPSTTTTAPSTTTTQPIVIVTTTTPTTAATTTSTTEQVLGVSVTQTTAAPTSTTGAQVLGVTQERTLARTGAATNALLVAGLVLIGGGAGMLQLAARRR